MKIFNTPKTVIIIFLLIITGNIKAQQKLSFDLAGIRNMHSEINGLNLSCFIHFNEHLAGGIEMNRFFPVSKNNAGETIKLSAWDFDLNFHYLLPLYKKLNFYPITGISHTSEKEWIIESNESKYDRFWSFNAGAGLLYEWGKWSPHIEYLFTWGKFNQQFILAGISYELELGRKEKK